MTSSSFSVKWVWPSKMVDTGFFSERSPSSAASKFEMPPSRFRSKYIDRIWRPQWLVLIPVKIWKIKVPLGNLSYQLKGFVDAKGEVTRYTSADENSDPSKVALYLSELALYISFPSKIALDSAVSLSSNDLSDTNPCTKYSGNKGSERRSETWIQICKGHVVSDLQKFVWLKMEHRLHYAVAIPRLTLAERVFHRSSLPGWLSRKLHLYLALREWTAFSRHHPHPLR